VEGFTQGSGSCRAESAKEVQERLPNWPWHRVEISELKEMFKEDQYQPDVWIGTGTG